ncbi:MAG: NAD(P)-binding domain-containing protein [Myxococcales bacterium]|nr:NAD(P)-binding domain-containing protein [Myxococcales bacterium]
MVIEALGCVLFGGLVGIGVLTIASFVRSQRLESKGQRDHADALAKGAQPASLHPRIHLDRCIGSGSCVRVCPEGDVLAVLDGKATVVNPTSCIGHGECMRACPVDAIELVLGTAKRGVDIPMVASDFQTSVPGLYVVGELGGMGLVYNAMTQAMQCLDSIRAAPPPPTKGVHQLIIVGAGPAGIAAALSAMEAGLDFVVVDQETIGGTVLQYPRHKIVMTRPVDLPLYGRLHVTEVRKEALLDHWHQIIDKTGLSVRTGVRVDQVERGADEVFTLRTSVGAFRAQRVVLALGRRGTPRKLGVPGEGRGKVVYRLIDAEDYAGKSTLVVGGGDAGVEAAISLGEAGAHVHLAHRKRVFDRIKAKNQKRLDEAVEAGRVRLLLEAKVSEIDERTVLLTVEGQPMTLDNDRVIVLIGGVLPTKFLQDAGIEIATFKGELYAPANT